MMTDPPHLMTPYVTRSTAKIDMYQNSLSESIPDEAPSVKTSMIFCDSSGRRADAMQHTATNAYPRK